jgi:hypothetical protein
MTNDRAAKLIVEDDVMSVLEFMQRNIPTAKLCSVASRLPEIGRLLWGHYPQEPLIAVHLSEPRISGEKQSAATEFERVGYADGDSVKVACGSQL